MSERQQFEALTGRDAITGQPFSAGKTDYTALAAYAVEQNAQAAIASGEPESDAASTWTTLVLTTEMMVRYRRALEIITKLDGPRAANIARAALHPAI